MPLDIQKTNASALTRFRDFEIAPNVLRSRMEAERVLGQMQTQQPTGRFSIEVVELDRPRDFYLQRYPRIVAHVICESLGYAIPSVAAQIVKDAAEERENWCEWIYLCFGKDPRKAVEGAIANRHKHKGYMAEYQNARALVDKANSGGGEPLLASWF